MQSVVATIASKIYANLHIGKKFICNLASGICNPRFQF